MRPGRECDHRHAEARDRHRNERACTQPLAEHERRRQRANGWQGAEDDSGVARRSPLRARDQQDRIADAADGSLCDEQQRVAQAGTRKRRTGETHEQQKNRQRDPEAQRGGGQRIEPGADGLARNDRAAYGEHGRRQLRLRRLRDGSGGKGQAPRVFARRQSYRHEALLVVIRLYRLATTRRLGSLCVSA
ncbi:hypothetical protein NECAME_16337 [Necator americanus]|uniref:Uncharacterized protein n=1 Tax=Necator americanus TaxID=51031 RepID=W2TWI8_NECAM|nr:hypothetical protein NECAME_16337 [Necator americanus]ETN86435.1 hypothetical protein NECAME_16337 [Necator americanus]